MEIPAKQYPLSESAFDSWENWMDSVEVMWYVTMEVARVEYEGIRDALQTHSSAGLDPQDPPAAPTEEPAQ